MLTRRWLPLLLGLNLLLLVFYLLMDYQLAFQSDSAVKNLLAQEIYETGQYFPLEWNYVNHDLWVFYTQTFIIPLLPFFHNGYLLHVASDLVSATLILYGSWLLTGLLEQSRLARLLSMLVMSGGMSFIMAEHIYGQAAYGSMYYMACFLIYAYWSFSQASGGKRLWWAGATAVLTLLVFWANPQRALLFYGLPLLAGGAVQQALEWRTARDERRAVAWRQAQAMGVVLLGLIAGVLLSSYTLGRVNSSQGLTVVHWLSLNSMQQNLLGVFSGMMSLFDGIPNPQGKVASLAGGYAALRLIGALLMLLLLPWGLCKALQPHRGPRQLVVVFAAVSFAANLFIMLATSVADMNAPDASIRYLVPSLLYMLLVLVGLVVDRRALPPTTRTAGLVAIVLLATSAPTAYLYPFNENPHMGREGLILKTPDQQLTRFLKDQGLQYGYATFWNAGKNTVLSSGAVRLRPVEFDHGLPLPTRKLSSNRWYTPEAWQGPTFLLLRDSEMPLLNQALLASQAGQPRVLRYQDANILVYPHNLAAVLPEWDIAVRQPVRYSMNEKTLHERGTLADGSITAQPGEAGTLHFGPMRMLGAGNYAVTFDLDTSGDGQGDYGMLDVVTQSGHKVHARQQVTAAGKQHITLCFSTPNTLDMVEFRVFSSGRGRFVLNGIDVVRIPQVQEKP